MEKPLAPPTLIYDHVSDPQEQLWDRLHERSRLAPDLRVIVHLKAGSAVIGNLRYYDNTRLTLAIGGQLRDVLYQDVAHVLQASEAV
jgi:hypothetical protein